MPYCNKYIYSAKPKTLHTNVTSILAIIYLNSKEEIIRILNDSYVRSHFPPRIQGVSETKHQTDKSKSINLPSPSLEKDQKDSLSKKKKKKNL